MTSTPTGSLVILISQEGEQFPSPRECVTISQFIKEMICDDSEDENPEVPLPYVESKVLAQVVLFMSYYHRNPMNNIPKPIPWPSRVSDYVQEWYSRYFIRLRFSLSVLNFVYGRFCYLQSYEMLFALTSAANYLDIPQLLELCCARIGRLMMNKTPDQIKALFNFTDQDFTDDVIETLKEKNRWSSEPVSAEDMEAEPESLLERLRASSNSSCERDDSKT